jgi:hypothetical protein
MKQLKRVSLCKVKTCFALTNYNVRGRVCSSHGETIRTELKFGKLKGMTYLRNKSSDGKIILKYMLESKLTNLLSESGFHSKGKVMSLKVHPCTGTEALYRP